MDARDSYVWPSSYPVVIVITLTHRYNAYGLVGLSPSGHHVILGLEDMEGRACGINIYIVCIHTLEAFNRGFNRFVCAKRENVDLHI